MVHEPVKKEPKAIREFLKVPEGYEVPALVALGYVVPDTEIPAQVKATVESKTHWNRW